MKYITFRIKIFVASLLALVLGTGHSFAQQWQSLDTTGFSNGIATYTYLAFGNGVPHLAYSDASKRGRATVKRYSACGAWQDVGASGFSIAEASHVHLAFDGSTPYVGYTDWGNGFKATVMRFNGSTWQPVGSAGFTPGRAWFSSLAISSSQPYLAFQDASRGNKLTVMRYNGSAWELVGNGGFSDGIASFIQLVFQGSTPYVVFLDAGNQTRITVMRYNGSTWEKVGKAGFSPGTASYPSLAFDGSTPYVAFQDGTRNNRATLMRFNGSSWTTVSAGFSAGTVEYVSLAVSSSGEPYVAYRDGGNGNRATVLKYNGSIWQAIDKVGFSGGRVEYTHLIFDGGKPYVAYQDGSKRRRATVMGLGGPKIEVFGNSNLIVNGDTTPSADDYTDFARTNDLTRQFTIENPGTSTLAICAISMSGVNAADFQVINAPLSIAPGGSATFSVRFRPSASGNRQANLVIRSNAPEDMMNYTFLLKGRRPTDPKIVVRGNGQVIANQKAAPSLEDHTDFGKVPNQLARIFQIQNTGNDTLYLANAYVLGSEDFKLESFPTRVNENQSLGVVVRFTPTKKGEQTAEIFIESNDDSNPVYRFTIKGNTAPAIRVLGNGLTIVSGDATPSLNDHTQFGQHEIGQSFTRSFTIENSASLEDLQISEVSISNPAFLIDRQPAAISAVSSQTLDITFKPSAAGRTNGIVTIKHNAGSEYTFTIAGTGCLPPPQDATALVFRGVPGNALNISWTNGTGQRRLVLLKEGSPITQGPLNGQSYTANPDFASDSVSVIDSAKVVFVGIQNRVTVTGLKRGVNYYAAVYEFNLSAGDCELRYSSGAFSGPTTDIEASDVVSIFPNPAQTTIQLSLLGQGTATLYSLEGIEYLKQQIQDKSMLDVSHLKRGLYLLKVDVGSSQSILKIVLE